MKSFFEKEVLAHPVVFFSLVVVAVMAAGSYSYYVISSRAPAPLEAGLEATTTASVTGTGVVTPAQNPDLAFASGGRVAFVRATVGESVMQGQLVAALDTSAFAAQKAQAQASLAAAGANLAMQQAKLSGLQAGARPEDIAASQAALDKAQQDLANMYASIPDAATDGYSKANDAVRTQLEPLFSNGDTASPQLPYATSNSQAKIDAEAQRAGITGILNAWQTRLMNTDSTTAASDALLKQSVSNLTSVRQLLNTVSSTLDGASGILTATTLAAYKAAVAAGLTEVNAASKNLDTIGQGIASQKLTVAQAEAQLQLKQAGASADDIKAQEAQVESAQAQVESAQASIEGINAQIANAVIVAPFSGEVTRVDVKEGQIVAPNTVGVSLMPKSALQVEAYVSEIDVAKMKTGMAADITLDAYGSSRHFPAIVVTVDHSPTMQNTIPAYKVTLQFNADDPAIATGMTANITIPLSQ